MEDVVSFTMQNLRKDRPVHLLGIGLIEDIFHGVQLGIDTFDCVHPTRIARHGGALAKAKTKNLCKVDSKRNHLNLYNQQFERDNSPIEADCACQTCQKYSRGYIHHLLKAEEMLANILIARHNAYFMNDLMSDIRDGIENKTLDEVKGKWKG
jgi:queuine tRNA-ribosyltransferase